MIRRQLTLFSLLLISSSIAAADNIIWTAVFSNVTPRDNKTSQSYCEKHSPTVMVTTLKDITSTLGTTTLNGLNIRYLSYKSEKKDGLLFNTVNAIIKGKDEKGEWSSPLKMYQQTLSQEDNGKTWVVWSTKKCKGSFIGTPTLIK